MPLYPSRFVHDFAKAIGVYSLDTLTPDRQGLRFHGLRNYPYEIARASAAQLQSDFSSPDELIANVSWQAFLYYQKTGKVPYANAFSAFFYRPLQAILYRAGYLTPAHMRAPATLSRFWVLSRRLAISKPAKVSTETLSTAMATG